MSVTHDLRNRQVFQQDDEDQFEDSLTEMADQSQQHMQEAMQRLEENMRNMAVRPTMGSLPSSFSAKPGEDASNFIDICVAWCDLNGQRDAAGLVNVFQLIMQGPARSWLRSLTDDE